MFDCNVFRRTEVYCSGGVWFNPLRVTAARAPNSVRSTKVWQLCLCNMYFFLKKGGNHRSLGIKGVLSQESAQSRSRVSAHWSLVGQRVLQLERHLTEVCSGRETWHRDGRFMWGGQATLRSIVNAAVAPLTWVNVDLKKTKKQCLSNPKCTNFKRRGESGR